MFKPKQVRVQGQKRRGPAPRLPPMEDTHVFLPPDLKEWAKHEREGLAELVRWLLARERKHRERLQRSEAARDEGGQEQDARADAPPERGFTLGR
jgi:hypothetical protein